MRSSLIIIGVIFLIVGGFLYYIPNQQFSANTTVVTNGNPSTQTSLASVYIPTGLAAASVMIGFILLVLGMVMPDAMIKTIRSPAESYKTTTVREDVGLRDGGRRRRKVVRTSRRY